MEKIIFREEMEGLEIDEIIRDHEYSMTSKHFHDSYELYFLLNGERYYFIDKETYLVRQGMVVLIKKNQIHKTSMAGKSYHDRILLQIKSEIFDSWLRSMELITLEELFSQNYGVLCLTEEDWNQMNLLLCQIKAELQKRQGHYQKMVKLKVIEILLLVYRYQKSARFGNEPQMVQTAKHKKVHEVADYLLNYCETEESLEELANRFFISKSYLCRIFKEVTGFTVNEYLNLTRVKKAQNLLVHSDYSITEIAGVVGFESITYFERVFKMHTDCSPLKYRKQYQ